MSECLQKKVVYNMKDRATIYFNMQVFGVYSIREI